MLWFPRQWLRNGGRLFKRRRTPRNSVEKLAGQGSRDPEDKSVHPGKEFKTFRNYVDFFRALAGGHSLSVYSFTATGPDSQMTVLAIQIAVLLGAVAIQAVRLENGRHNYFAPIFWLVGLGIGYTSHYAPLFSFALVLAINPALPNPRWFLTAYGLLLLAVGLVLDAAVMHLALIAGLILLVPLASLLAKRPLVIYARKPRTASASS